MKKIQAFCLIGLSCVIASCDWLGNGGEDPISLPPEITQATASPAVVDYNGNTVISWQVKNATKVTIDGVTVNGNSIEMKNLVASKIVNIVAYNDGLQPATKTVSVEVKDYVPTRTDTLCAKSISLSSMIVLNKDNVVIFDSNLSESQKSNIYWFYKDGTSKGFSKDGVQISLGTWSWGTAPREIIMSKESFGYILTDKNLILSRQNNDKTETTIITYKRN